MRSSNPSVLAIGSPGSPPAKGFRVADQVYRSTIATLPSAARIFHMSRRQLYSLLFSNIHVTPPGVVWKFRGRHMVDLEKLEAFLRGEANA